MCYRRASFPHFIIALLHVCLQFRCHNHTALDSQRTPGCLMPEFALGLWKKYRLFLLATIQYYGEGCVETKGTD